MSITDTLPGRTVAFRVAEVRPQVSGIIQKRLFTEGSEVKEGEQLLQIDPATYRASLASAQASLQRAEAQLTSARLLEERYKPLLETKSVSQQNYDNAAADRGQAEADVAAARAQVEAARINVVYTQVRSPISGRIGRALVTEGALVTGGQTQPLALVQQLDPIYVDISQSSTQLLRLRQQLASGDLQQDGSHQADVILTLEDGRQYSERGKLQVAEVSVDPTTGAVVLRAIIPNPKRELLPGMFVRAQLVQGERKAALLVPQRGVSRNQRGEATVLVVGADNKVTERVVSADTVIKNEWLVTQGLNAGDRVIVDGLQKAKPGQEVRTVEAPTEAAAEAQAAAKSAAADGAQIAEGRGAGAPTAGSSETRGDGARAARPAASDVAAPGARSAAADGAQDTDRPAAGASTASNPERRGGADRSGGGAPAVDTSGAGGAAAGDDASSSDVARR